MVRIVLLASLIVALPLRAEEVNPKTWHRVVGLLEYLEGDYGNALNSGDQAELEEQRGLADEVVKQLEAAGPSGATYLGRARELEAAIVAGSPVEQVAPRCGALAKLIITEQEVVRTPQSTPSLEQGKAHYETNCASCHGLEGAAKTELAKGLTPPPANFLDAARMSTLTPYKVFNTSTFGIKGTAMAGFEALPEDVRWAQAFHVFTLRQPPCTRVPPSVGLFELATSTDTQLAARYGEGEVACLRRVLPRRAADTLTIAQKGLDDALALYEQGDLDGARQAVVDAYLNGLEPLEPKLRARDGALVENLEQAFTRTRLAAQSGQHFEVEVGATQALLKKAQNGSSASGFWSVFVAAFFILLREGFEAVIVVGALLAVLKKLGATSQARVVHAGWVSALMVGAAAFVFGQAFFAGANREWLETVVALGAVGLLLYAALWLNARVNVSKYMGELRGKMSAALGNGSVTGLFFIAFTSVGRESIETALFLQGLATDSRSGVAWGAAAGLLGLLGMVVMIRTVGFKLPMKTLFTASTVLLVVTAVMLLGKGVHGLQELGVLPLSPVPFVQLDALGLFPDAWPLLAQLGLASAALAWKVVRQWPESFTRRPGPKAT